MTRMFRPIFLLGLVVALGACARATPAPTPLATEPSATSPASVPTPAPAPTLTAPTNRVVGYYAAWATGREYFPANIPADKLTHINYAFSNVSEDGECILGDPAADIERPFTASESVSGVADSDEAGAMRGNFNQLKALKQAYPHLQILIAIGGWNWSSNFSEAAATDASRQAFARSCIGLYLQKYPGVFDGLDLDWEFPVSGGMNPGRPEDKANFTLLLAELRQQLDALGSADGKHYWLTIAAPIGPGIMPNLERDQIIRYVDWINLMTYDFHGTWETKTNFNAPLYQTSGDTEATLNIDAAVHNYLDAGVPADRLVLGVPFYGRGWQGVPATDNGLHQATTQGAAPNARGEAGAFEFNDLQQNYLSTYARFWNDEAQVPWLYNPDTGIFISYDDAESLAAKAGYAKDQGLGGVMIWELSQGNRDLLEALHQGFKTGGRPHVVPTANPSATQVPRPFTQEIQAVSDIQINGDLSDWPTEPTFTFNEASQVVYSLTPKSWDGPSDLSALAWVGWSEAGLYFAFQVTDDKHQQTSAGVDLWHGDYLELQIDTQLEEDYDSPGMNEDDYQLGLSAGDFGKVPATVVAWFGPATEAQLQQIQQAQVQTAEGYVLEAFIPVAVLPGLRLSEGAAFGMNLNPSDADAGNQEVMMSTSAIRTLTDPRTFGKFVLVRP